MSKGPVISNDIRRLRFEAGEMTQKDLAHKAKVTRQTIIAIETDKYDPSLPMAYRMAAFFDVPVEALFFNPWKG